MAQKSIEFSQTCMATVNDRFTFKGKGKHNIFYCAILPFIDEKSRKRQRKNLCFECVYKKISHTGGLVQV